MKCYAAVFLLALFAIAMANEPKAPKPDTTKDAPAADVARDKRGYVVGGYGPLAYSAYSPYAYAGYHPYHAYSPYAYPYYRYPYAHYYNAPYIVA